MAAKTTVKVATLTGAAKDDLLTSAASGLTEEKLLANLDVLSNDPGSAKVYSLLQNAAATLTSTTQFPVVTSVKLASGATISINADGTIAYNASTVTANLQAYGAGEVFIDTFEYTIRMANGALSTAKATVEIAGVNDVPTLASVAAVSTLDTADADAAAVVAGKLAGADTDRTAVLSYSLLDGSLESTNAYGTLLLNSATGTYEFVVNADKLDALNAGATARASFEVKVEDEHGAASAPVTLQFDLIGANDTAAIDGVAAGSVTEDDGLTVAGKLDITDRDTGEAVFSLPASLSGTYGDFTFDNATGEWTYALRNGDANVQALNGGKTVVDTLDVTSLDGTASKTISVEVTGANDAARIGGDVTGSVSEDGVANAGGVLTVQDLDTGEAGFLVPASLAGLYGDFSFDAATGAWTYALSNDSAQVQALSLNQQAFDELTIKSLDGSTSQTIRVSIDGRDEAPTQGGNAGTQPVNEVYELMVNHGRTDINNKQTFIGFDSNDVVKYANNYEFQKNSITLLDTDGDGTYDSSSATFKFENNGGKVSVVEVVLVGYTGLTEAQIIG